MPADFNIILNNNNAALSAYNSQDIYQYSLRQPLREKARHILHLYRSDLVLSLEIIYTTEIEGNNTTNSRAVFFPGFQDSVKLEWIRWPF